MSENPLDQQIKEQGEVVRRLKAAKEPKEKVRFGVRTVHFSEEYEWKRISIVVWINICVEVRSLKLKTVDDKVELAFLYHATVFKKVFSTLWRSS